MTDEQLLLDKLSVRGIKPTAMRLLILRTMMHTSQAVSLLDLVDMLETADKSTDDGSGALKYAVCSNTCTCEVEDLHVHFYCTQCHRTLCLRGLPVPLVHLPDGFTLESVNYVMKGVCSDCRRKHN